MAPRMVRLTLPVVLLSAALPVGAVAGTAVAAPAASSGSVLDVTPLTKVLDAKKRHTEFLSANFQAEAGEMRFVGAELVVKDAKNTSPDRLFLGVTLSCTSPSGRVTSAEAGRNVWPAGSDFMIPVGFTMQTDAAGTHKCRADVMMCDPGNCAAPTGTGKVAIVTRAMNPKEYTGLFISASLPWAQSVRVPTGGDRLIKPGTSFRASGSLDIPGTPGPVRIGGVFSVTNCIEKAYPDVCKNADKTAIQGSALVATTLNLTQVGTSGAECATATATAGSGAGKFPITWQQHHAVLAIYVPDFTLSSAPGCTQTIRVDLTATAGKGNAVALEAGSKAKVSSMLYAIPGDALPKGQ